MAAEQVIKNSLILPADAITLQRLEPLVKVVEDSVSKDEAEALNDSYYLGWRTLALTLYENRRGDFTNAVVWHDWAIAHLLLREAEKMTK